MKIALLFGLLWTLLGNPFLALLVLLAVLYFLDRRFVGLTPSFTKPLRRRSRIAALRRELDANPSNSGSRLELARLQLERKRYAEARSTLEPLRESLLMEDSAEFWDDYGTSLLHTGREEEGRRRSARRWLSTRASNTARRICGWPRSRQRATRRKRLPSWRHSPASSPPPAKVTTAWASCCRGSTARPMRRPPSRKGCGCIASCPNTSAVRSGAGRCFARSAKTLPDRSGCAWKDAAPSVLAPVSNLYSAQRAAPFGQQLLAGSSPVFRFRSEPMHFYKARQDGFRFYLV